MSIRPATHFAGATPGTAVDPAEGGAREPLVLRDVDTATAQRAEIIRLLGELLHEVRTARLATQSQTRVLMARGRGQ